MSFEIERKAIEGHLNTNWTDATSKILWDNVQVLTPIAGKTLDLRILHTDSTPSEIGASPSFSRYKGLVSCAASVPENTGTAALNTMIDAFCTIFRKKKLSPATGHYITFGVPYLRELGIVEGRRLTVIYVPFYRDSLE